MIKYYDMTAITNRVSDSTKNDIDDMDDWKIAESIFKTLKC